MDSKFDLSINFIEQTTLEICWDFDQNLFDESSIRQLHAGLIAILRTVVADPDISLKKINISNNDIPIEIAQSDCQSTFSKFLQTNFLRTAQRIWRLIRDLKIIVPIAG